MKNSKKGITGITILLIGAVILLGGGFAAYKMSFKAKNPTTVTNANTMMQVSPTSTLPAPSGTMNTTTSVAKGTTNTDIDTDLQTIGGKINSENNAAADVDSSFNNQSADSVTIQ